jgi:hypothetical protein
LLKLLTFMTKAQPSLRKFLVESCIPQMSVVHESGFVGAEAAVVGGDGLGSESFGSAGQATSHDSDCVLVSALNVDPKPCPEPDVLILDPVLASPSHELARKRKKGYELNRHFQDSWAAKLPWAEAVVGVDGRIMQVRCKVCSDVERREKLLVPKIDSLWKHVGRRRALVDMAKVKRGEYYYLGSNQHVKNERVYYSKGGDTIVQKLGAGVVIERRKKLVQMKLLLHLLMQGHPMTDYVSAEQLFQDLNVPHHPRKHWSEGSGWEIAEAMAKVISYRTRADLAKASYISASADEVTTIDGSAWLSVHVYVCQNFMRVPILLSLQHVSEGANADNLTDMIMTTLRYHGGLEGDDVIAEKLLYFGADGAAVFQGARSGVTAQLTEKFAPYLMGVHCISHRTNLAV